MTHRKLITASINKYLDKARELYPNATIPNPTISFRMRGGTRLGMARYGGRNNIFEIRINDQISAKYLDDAINDTAPHEVAHLVAYKVHGKDQGHNHNWKRIMLQFGIAPNRLADDSLDTLEFKQFKAKTVHMYHCGTPTCLHSLGSGRHAKMRCGAVYTCRKTGGSLGANTYVSTVRKTAAEVKAEEYRKAGKPLPGAAPRAPAKVAKMVGNPPSQSRKAPTSPPAGSKKARAENLYQSVKGQARPDIIALFMSQLDMTTSGASTYYYNCKKKFG